MLLGPLACLIIGPIEGIAYLKSTKFFTLDYTLVTQIIPAFTYVFSCYIWAFSETQIITCRPIALAGVVLFMRIITVAVRYATTPPEMLQRMRKQDIRDEMWTDYILIGWTMVTPKLL